MKMDNLSNSLNQKGSIQYCLENGGSYFAATRNCYVSNSQEQKTWDDAQADCKKNGGDLATVADQATVDFLVGNVKVTTWTWIGGELKSGVWSWADGTPWTGFENWVSIPNTGDSNNGMLLKSNFEWNTASKANSWYYLCQYELHF